MVAGANALAIVGDARAVTVRFAALLPVPTVVCAVVMPDVVLGLVATLLLVTLKITVQLPLAGIVILVKLSAVAPPLNEDGVVPTQEPVTLPATALMFTSVSVKAPLVRADPLLFDRVTVTTEVPPDTIDAGANALAMVGTASTVRLALLLPVPTVVCDVVMPEVALGWTPGVLLVTLKITVQLPLAGMVIPVKLSAVAPPLNEDGVVPTQEPVTLPATALMFTSVSVKAPLVRADPLGLVNVRVTTEFPPD